MYNLRLALLYLYAFRQYCKSSRMKRGYVYALDAVPGRGFSCPEIYFHFAR